MTITVRDGRQAGTTVVRRGPGRPRSTGHDDSIVDAVLELLERGEEITVARVAIVPRRGDQLNGAELRGQVGLLAVAVLARLVGHRM